MICMAHGIAAASLSYRWVMIEKFRKCFQPRQWFYDDDGTECNLYMEDVLMWVYRKDNDGSWIVGFYMPDKTWVTESRYDATDEGKDKAAARVNYLNGGKGN